MNFWLLTCVVASWVVCNVSHIDLASWHDEIQLYSSIPIPQIKIFLALALFWIANLSSTSHLFLYFGILVSSSVPVFIGIVGLSRITPHRSVFSHIRWSLMPFFHHLYYFQFNSGGRVCEAPSCGVGGVATESFQHMNLLAKKTLSDTNWRNLIP